MGRSDGKDGDGDRRSTGRSLRRKTTLPGLVSPSRPEADADPNDRVTLDFTGPPLSLPGEDQTDTLPPPPDWVPPPEASVPSPSRLPGVSDEHGDDELALDLSDFPDAGESIPADHDGWTRERLRRGSGAHPTVPPSIRPPSQSDDPRALPGEEGGAIDLVDRSRSARHEMDLAAEMADRYALGDFTGALRAAELLLGKHPDDVEARRYASSSRDRLAQHYTSRLGSMGRVPRVAVPDSEVRWLGIDHKAGFLLSRVDGAHSLEEIVDMSGMPRLEALKMLAELLESGAIAFD